MKIIITTKILNREERLLTLNQCATKLKITRQAVLKMVDRGELRAVRFKEFNERIYLIPISDLKKLKRGFTI